MTDKVNTYITQLIDGTETRELLLHYRERFELYVRNSNNTKSYDRKKNWKVFLKPAIKPNSPPDQLLDNDWVDQDEWWEEVARMRESSKTSVVSDTLLQMVMQAIQPDTPYSHTRKFGEGMKLILEKRIKFDSLIEVVRSIKTEQQLKDFQEQGVIQLRNKLLMEVKRGD
jgi:hypothetical protein